MRQRTGSGKERPKKPVESRRSATPTTMPLVERLRTLRRESAHGSPPWRWRDQGQRGSWRSPAGGGAEARRITKRGTWGDGSLRSRHGHTLAHVAGSSELSRQSESPLQTCRAWTLMPPHVNTISQPEPSSLPSLQSRLPSHMTAVETNSSTLRHLNFAVISLVQPISSSPLGQSIARLQRAYPEICLPSEQVTGARPTQEPVQFLRLPMPKPHAESFNVSQLALA